MNLDAQPTRPFSEGTIKVLAMDSVNDVRADHTEQFEIVSKVHLQQQVEGETEGVRPKFAPHPIQAVLAGNGGPIKEIPITLFFDSPTQALRARYVAYSSATSQCVCTGNGAQAQRLQGATGRPETVECAGPENCNLVSSGTANCKRQVVMPVQIQGQDNPLSVFEVRTSSINSMNALKSQLAYLHARFKGLRHIPLKLQIWRASNDKSEFKAFDLIKLAIDAKDEIEAMTVRKKILEAEHAAGLEQVPDSLFPCEAATPTLADCIEFELIEDFYKPFNPAAYQGKETGVEMSQLNSGAMEMIRSAVRRTSAAPKE